MEIASLQYQGFRYYYKFTGGVDDPCMVIIGGVLQSLNAWDQYIDRYGEKFNVIVCDLPGMGESDTLPYHYGIDFLADSIENLFDTLSIKKASVVASSYGTPIAYLFAKKYPHRTARVILAGTMNHLPESLIRGMGESIQYLRSGDMEAACALLSRMFMCAEKSQDIRNARLARRLLASGVTKMSDIRKNNYIENTLRLLRTARLAFERVPSVDFLVFTGEYDNYTTPQLCLEVAQELDSAEYVLIRQADHLANIEQFDVFANLCSTFLDGKDIRAVPGCGGYRRFGSGY